MSEPTIDALVDWLDEASNANYNQTPDEECRDAIRVLLVEHRHRTESPGNTYEVAIIKSFVERVEARLPDYNTGKGADSWLKAYRVAVLDELTEMEKK